MKRILAVLMLAGAVSAVGMQWTAPHALSEAVLADTVGGYGCEGYQATYECWPQEDEVENWGRCCNGGYCTIGGPFITSTTCAGGLGCYSSPPEPGWYPNCCICPCGAYTSCGSFARQSCLYHYPPVACSYPSYGFCNMGTAVYYSCIPDRIGAIYGCGSTDDCPDCF